MTVLFISSTLLRNNDNFASNGSFMYTFPDFETQANQASCAIRNQSWSSKIYYCMYVQNSEVFLRTLNFRTLYLDSDSLLKRIWHKKCPRTEHESEWNDIGENDICDNWQIAKILIPWSQRLSFILSFLFGNLRREALIEAPSPREKKASGQDRWESHFHAGSALDSCQRCHFLLTNHKGGSDLQFVDRAGWVSFSVTHK